MIDNRDKERLIIENTSLQERIDFLESQLQQKMILAFDESSSEMQQFAYVATHDLKAPLNNMLGYISLLKMDIDNPSSEIIEYLKWLEYSVSEAKKVIQELTEVLHLKNDEKGKPVAINLDTLTEGILAGLRATILAKGVYFICDFSAVLELNYFPVPLRSILQNLVVNACAYMDPEKELREVWISSRREAKNIVIEIRDNGLGMDLQGKEKILFDAFQRLSDKPGGSGIGMYIVKSFLDNYGGHIEVKSSVGIGTTFTLYLPYR